MHSQNPIKLCQNLFELEKNTKDSFIILLNRMKLLLEKFMCSHQSGHLELCQNKLNG